MRDIWRPHCAETERNRREASVEETKTNLMSALSKVEEEIDKVEKEIKQAMRKKEKLEKEEKERQEKILRNENNPEEMEEENILEPWQEIYAKNRREAQISHRRFDSLNLSKTENGLGRKGILPQYNQPMDSEYLVKLKEEMKAFRPKLLAYMSRKKRLANTRDSVLSKKYDADLKKWNERVQKWEQSPKKRIRDAKTREVFERMFPELKRQRENQAQGRNYESAFGITVSGALSFSDSFKNCLNDKGRIDR